MTSPFDTLAPVYDQLWTYSPEGRAQREAVWREITWLFRPGDRVLEMGCGTGVDALELKARAVRVYAIDSSAEMVAAARARGVWARHLAIEQLSLVEGVFDGALSDFGALNCVSDLAPVAGELARLVRPKGRLALCLISRWCWPEIRRFAWSGQLHKAVRRLRGQSQWRGVTVYYPSSRAVRAAFSPAFRLDREVPIGAGDHRLYLWTRRDAW